MTRFELITGIAAFVIVAAVGAWILMTRFLKKEELTKTQRMVAGMVLAFALGLFFVAMPVIIWIKIGGLVLAVVMFFSSLYQWNPKLPERIKNRGKEEKAVRRRASDDYMPYYKRKQLKQKRNK